MYKSIIYSNIWSLVTVGTQTRSGSTGVCSGEWTWRDDDGDDDFHRCWFQACSSSYFGDFSCRSYPGYSSNMQSLTTSSSVPKSGFCVGGTSTSEMQRLKDDLMVCQMKLTKWEEGIQQARTVWTGRGCNWCRIKFESWQNMFHVVTVWYTVGLSHHHLLFWKRSFHPR